MDPRALAQSHSSAGLCTRARIGDLRPDGHFAAFPIIWYDQRNRTGLFEPVGVAKDYQRRGLGRALMHYGMRQMAAAGMTHATVAHFGDNAAARGL